MNFFRLRIINTLLLFLIGMILGFILKEKFYPAAKPPVHQAYNAAAPSDEQETPPVVQPETEEPADEPYAAQEPENEPAPVQAAAVAPPKPALNRGMPRAAPEALVIETAAAPEESPGPAPAASEDPQDDFFKNPAAYEGRELALNLQMITARKSQRGWRVNLVYTGPDKKIDYLYVEDSKLLGEKPDLRIGYAYKIRFLCGKGDPASGNTLLTISPTGEKAAWATGLSAVE